MNTDRCVNIRKADISDADRLCSIESGCFSFPHTLEQIQWEIESSHHLWIVAESTEIIGFISMQYVLDEGCIGNVAVEMKYRHNGIGDRLVSAALSEARTLGLSFLTLEVRNSNIAALGLYEKHGFEKTGVMKGYYASPKEDAVIMTVNL